MGVYELLKHDSQLKGHTGAKCGKKLMPIDEIMNYVNNNHLTDF